VTADPSLDGARTVLVGGLATSGAVVDWLLAALAASAGTGGAGGGSGGGDVRGESGNGGYAALPGLLADVRLPTGIVVEPYLRGRMAPAPDRDRRMTWSGIAAGHGAGDLLAAAIEGTCLHTRWTLDELTALTGTTPQRLAVFGGQVRIPLWMRVKAAVSPVPVQVVRADDAVCAGAALIAGQAGGSLDDVPVLPAERLPPDPEIQAAYLPLYDRFRTSARAPRRQEHA
jgi:sugar (pentulose or hexulose) kinase